MKTRAETPHIVVNGSQEPIFVLYTRKRDKFGIKGEVVEVTPCEYKGKQTLVETEAPNPYLTLMLDTHGILHLWFGEDQGRRKKSGYIFIRKEDQHKHICLMQWLFEWAETAGVE